MKTRFARIWVALISADFRWVPELLEVALPAAACGKNKKNVAPTLCYFFFLTGITGVIDITGIIGSLWLESGAESGDARY